MINGNDLNRCIDILSELNANANNKRDKSLILELGYIIKQELDLVKAWESSHNGQRLRCGGAPIDIEKLLEDNAQLYKENETLLKNLNKLKGMIESKIPAIQEDLTVINRKFDLLNNHIETNLC
jgi:hypothetical protein